MTHSPHSSSASVSCRLEWRPSRCLIGALLLGGVLASFSVQMSDMARPAAWLLTACVLIRSAGLARRESSLSRRSLVFPGTGSPLLVDGTPVEQVDVQWRGPLVFVSWKDGKAGRERLSWWPDTLPAARRRELRLAAGDLEASRHALAVST